MMAYLEGDGDTLNVCTGEVEKMPKKYFITVYT